MSGRWPGAFQAKEETCSGVGPMAGFAWWLHREQRREGCGIGREILESLEPEPGPPVPGALHSQVTSPSPAPLPGCGLLGIPQFHGPSTR